MVALLTAIFLPYTLTKLSPSSADGSILQQKTLHSEKEKIFKILWLFINWSHSLQVSVVNFIDRMMKLSRYFLARFVTSAKERLHNFWANMIVFVKFTIAPSAAEVTMKATEAVKASRKESTALQMLEKWRGILAGCDECGGGPKSMENFAKMEEMEETEVHNVPHGLKLTGASLLVIQLHLL